MAFSSETTGVETIINSTPATELINVVSKAPLADFLSRPVLIHTLTWTPATLGFHIDPWALFLNDTSVRAKLDSYGRLRGTMNIDILVNGTPFHYGRLLVSYCPNVEPKELVEDLLLIQHSQLPHVLVNPCLNVTSTITAPYTSNYYWMDLNQVNATHVGVLYVDVMNNLEMANVAPPSNVTVSFFAYMTDVELTVASNLPTAVFTSQSKNVKKTRGITVGTKDEYSSTGAISAPASAVAHIAGLLRDAPFIGKFARATEIAAGAIANVASLFGFSQPTSLAPINLMKQTLSTNFAETSGTDMSRRLCVDPKQELTIDSRVMGLDGTDEMSISHIASTPSYLTSWSWLTTQPADTILFELPVTPCYTKKTAVTAGFSYDDTPSGALSRMFSYWTGTMEYHLQIVSSDYHRGRLRITYIPGISDGSYDPAEYNENYSQIVDISSTTDFAFSIGFVARQGFLKTTMSDLNVAYAFDPLAHNGTIVVSVVNTLVAPLAGQGISLNVWTSAGKDLQFAAPRDLDPHLTYYAPQSREVQKESSGDDCCEAVVYFPLVPSSPRDEITLAHYGESIASLRTLLKRDACWGQLPLDYDTALAREYGTTYCNFTRMPVYPGYAPAGTYSIHQTTTAIAYNYTRLIPLTYVSKWFLGNRGGVRMKFATPHIEDFNRVVGKFRHTNRISRQDWDLNSDWAAGTVTNNGSIASQEANFAKSSAELIKLNDTFVGVTYVNDANQFLEVELPDYNPLIYHTPGDHIGADEISTGGIWIEDFKWDGGVSLTVNDGNTRPLVYTSTGEDFNLLFFRGTRRIYTQTTIPGPSGTYKLPAIA